jgi:hypothetical protein
LDSAIPYLLLNRTAKEIRLIRLFPAQDRQARLCCSLIRDKLDTARYIALSYVGRDQQVDRELLEVVMEHNADNLRPGVTRTRFKKIGRNLVAALRQLRALKEEILIWIDAICI